MINLNRADYIKFMESIIDAKETARFKYKGIEYFINCVDGKTVLLNEGTGDIYEIESYDELKNFELEKGKSIYDLKDLIELIYLEYNNEKEFTSAALMNREIEFSYKGVEYFKSSCEIDKKMKYTVYCERDGSHQYFNSNEELLEKAKLEDKFLKDVFDEIVIHCIL